VTKKQFSVRIRGWARPTSGCSWNRARPDIRAPPTPSAHRRARMESGRATHGTPPADGPGGLAGIKQRQSQLVSDVDQRRREAARVLALAREQRGGPGSTPRADTDGPSACAEKEAGNPPASVSLHSPGLRAALALIPGPSSCQGCRLREKENERLVQTLQSLERELPQVVGADSDEAAQAAVAMRRVVEERDDAVQELRRVRLAERAKMETQARDQERRWEQREQELQAELAALVRRYETEASECKAQMLRDEEEREQEKERSAAALHLQQQASQAKFDVREAELLQHISKLTLTHKSKVDHLARQLREAGEERREIIERLERELREIRTQKAEERELATETERKRAMDEAKAATIRRGELQRRAVRRIALAENAAAFNAFVAACSASQVPINFGVL